MHGGRKGDARSGQLHGQVRARADLPADVGRANRQARAQHDDWRQPGAARHRVHDGDYGAARVGIGNLGAGSLDHDSAGGARRRERRRVHHTRLRLSAARARRRRAGAHGTDRGRGRSRAAGGTEAGRRHLRDSERRRHDGAARRPGRVRQGARAQDCHRRGHHRVPPAQRDDGPANRGGEAADGISASSARSFIATWSTTRSTWCW